MRFARLAVVLADAGRVLAPATVMFALTNLAAAQPAAGSADDPKQAPADEPKQAPGDEQPVAPPEPTPSPRPDIGKGQLRQPTTAPSRRGDGGERWDDS